MQWATTVEGCCCKLPAIQTGLLNHTLLGLHTFAARLIADWHLFFAAGSVRMNPLTSKATDSSIEKEIKEWLKFASERDGGNKLRQIKKQRDQERMAVTSRRQQSIPEFNSSDTERH